LNFRGNMLTGPLPLHLLGYPTAADDHDDFHRFFGPPKRGESGGEGGSGHGGGGGGGCGEAAADGEADEDVGAAAGGGGGASPVRSPSLSLASLGSLVSSSSVEDDLDAAASKKEAKKQDALRKFPSLTLIDISSNNLTGPLPFFLPPFQNKLAAAHAHAEKESLRLTGKPLKKLRHPPVSTGLRFLDLSDNALSGCLPWGLGGLLALKELNLGGNRLTG
jgi:hypothetical protein